MQIIIRVYKYTVTNYLAIKWLIIVKLCCLWFCLFRSLCTWYTDRQTHKPWLTVLADQANKRVNLCSSDMFLQQLAVVMEQSCDRVLCQDVITDLFLHEAKLFGNIFLQNREINSLNIHQPKQNDRAITQLSYMCLREFNSSKKRGMLYLTFKRIYYSMNLYQTVALCIYIIRKGP